MTDHEVRVWDPLVRIFHWTLVTAFAVAWLSGDEESAVHVYAGYLIIVLLAFRVFWGFVGSRHARFGDFLYSPRRVLQYLKSLRSGAPEVYPGHNPAGGWMIILLLVSLVLASYTGLKVYGIEGHGPLASADAVVLVAPAQADESERERGELRGEDGEKDGEEFWEELHEFFANLTVLLVVIHVAGVIVASRLHGENLVRAMITGNKRAP